MLADPTRVRLLHTLSTSPAGAMRIGDLADGSGRQPVHVLPPRRAAPQGRLRGGRQGRHLEHGLGQRRLLHRSSARRRRRHGHPGRPRRAAPRTCPPTSTTRPVTDGDMPVGARHLRRGPRDPQRHVRDQGPHRRAACEPSGCPSTGLGRRARRRGRRLDRHHARSRHASATPASARRSVYVTETARGRGVGKALLFTQVIEADQAGHVDAADLDLPREPGQPRPAPLRRLPHPRRAHPHRAARRRLARHRAPRAPQRERDEPARSGTSGTRRGPVGATSSSSVAGRRVWRLRTTDDVLSRSSIVAPAVGHEIRSRWERQRREGWP